VFSSKYYLDIKAASIPPPIPMILRFGKAGGGPKIIHKKTIIFTISLHIYQPWWGSIVRNT